MNRDVTPVILAELTFEVPDSWVCLSDAHEAPVPTKVSGLYRNPYRNGSTSAPAAYCSPCAITGEGHGFFDPDGDAA